MAKSGKVKLSIYADAGWEIFTMVSNVSVEDRSQSISRMIFLALMFIERFPRPAAWSWDLYEPDGGQDGAEWKSIKHLAFP